MNYCCGFVFNKELDRVLLIKKNKGPANMAGKLNGIGGKVEKDESAKDATIRECREETGMNIDDWNYFACLTVDGYHKVYFYYAIVDSFTFTERVGDFFTIKSIYSQLEAEEIDDYWIKINPNKDIYGDYTDLPHMPNLEYLIPMAINHYKRLDSARSFDIVEGY